MVASAEQVIHADSQHPCGAVAARPRFGSRVSHVRIGSAFVSDECEILTDSCITVGLPRMCILPARRVPAVLKGTKIGLHAAPKRWKKEDQDAKNLDPAQHHQPNEQQFRALTESGVILSRPHDTQPRPDVI